MIVAATGHRPEKLGGYGMTVQANLFRLARGWLETAKPKAVISGMALGWDTAVARAALDAGVLLTCAIPFAGQASRWQPEDRAEYFRILRTAYCVHYVSEPGYSAAKMMLRNRWMVDAADAVVALWDGTDGGTANCVRYARSKGLEPVNLWQRWEQLK